MSLIGKIRLRKYSKIAIQCLIAAVAINWAASSPLHAEAAAVDTKAYDSGAWELQYNKSLGGNLVFSENFGGGQIHWKLTDSNKQYSCRAVFKLPSQAEYPQDGVLRLDAVFGPGPYAHEPCPADLVQMSVGAIDRNGSRKLSVTVGTHQFEGTLLKLVSFDTPSALLPRIPDNLAILGTAVGMSESAVIASLSDAGYTVVDETNFLPSRHVFNHPGGFLESINARDTLGPILQEMEPFYSVKSLTREPEGYGAYKADSKTPINLLPDTIQLISIGDTIASISRVIPFDQSIFEKIQSDLTLKYGSGADGGVPVLRQAKVKRVALFGRSGKEVDPKSSVGGAGYPWSTNECFPTIDVFQDMSSTALLIGPHPGLFSDPIRHCAVEVQYSMMASDGSVPAMAHVQISSRAIAQYAAMKSGLSSALDKVLSATYDEILQAQNTEATEAASPDL